MEHDRAQTNLGPAAEHAVPEEAPVAPKQPRRRFVGRKKEPDAHSDQPARPNANIEDASAIQGGRPTDRPVCASSRPPHR